MGESGPRDGWAHLSVGRRVRRGQGERRRLGRRRDNDGGALSQRRQSLRALDMSGNVWEWTRSLWVTHGAYPYPSTPAEASQRERVDAPDNVARVMRGGSQDYNNVVRAAYRDVYKSIYRVHHVGFRVVASLLRS